MSDTNSALAALNAQAPDISASAPSQPDNSALTQQAPPPSPIDPGQAPDIQSGQPSPVLPTQNATPAPPAGQASVWKDLVRGALQGLAGSAGTHSVGAGLAAGARSELDAQQRDIKQASDLKFQSLQAAHEAVLARLQAAQADNLEQETKEKQSDYAANVDSYLRDHSMKPSVTITGSNPGDMHSQGAGALTTLAQQNGGTIPRTATTNDPIGAGADPNSHTINVYSPTEASVGSGGTGNARKQIDTYLQVTRGYPATQDEIDSGFGAVKNDVPSQGTPNHDARIAGLRNQQVTAAQFLQPPLIPKGESGKVDVGTAASMTANMQQQLDTYKQNPNADSKMVAILQQKIDVFQGAVQGAVKTEANLDSQRIAGTSAANANAAAATETAKKNADATAPEGRLQLQKTQQEIVDAKYRNAAQQQQVLFKNGVDPVSGEKLNLSNAPDEFLVDGRTHQPVPTSMLSTLKPTQQESNRADFAQSALHSLDLIDKMRAQGRVPNGPISGWTAKGLVKAGLSNADAAEVTSLITLTQSAATGAHVGGRFSSQIMDKMSGLLSLNANDEEFTGQSRGLRDVMTPYAQNGGRVTVGQYKSELIGSTKSVGGKNYTVSGLDRNGNAVLTPAQ
jgi:hypothetical protein